MALVTESFLVDALLAVVTLLGIVYYYFTATFDHWQKLGVPYPKPQVFFGNIKDQILQRKHVLHQQLDLYNSLSGKSFGGYFEFRTPVLMIRDPKMVETILIKDFSYFGDRGFPADENEPLSASLFSMEGQSWKNLRNKLTPTFTSGKLKGMFDQICNCGGELLKEIEQSTSRNEVVEAKALGTIFTIDVAASCGFGLQFKAGSPEGIRFREMATKVFAPSQTFLILLVISFRSLAKLLRIRQMPADVTDYFMDLVRTTMQFREKNNIQRGDFLQLMMNLRAQEQAGKEINWRSELSEEDAYLNQQSNMKIEKKKSGEKVMTDECIAAQSFVFLAGASEAIANSVAYTIYELAYNPVIQKRVQEEVDSTLKKHGGKLTYEGLRDMTYLDLVIQEKNRKYSEVGSLFRVCTSPYKVPGTDIVIEKGTRLLIPTYAIHHDPTYYEDPEKFIPERFEGNNHRTSGTYLPFGDGPRICIAMRFALLTLKACVAQMMSKYSVTLDPKTKVPLQIDPKSFLVVPIGGILVKFQTRNHKED